MSNMKKSNTKDYIYKTEKRLRDIEKSVVTKGEREEVRDKLGVWV